MVWIPRASVAISLIRALVLATLCVSTATAADASNARESGHDDKQAMASADSIVVYAAGSLREAMQALQSAYSAERAATRSPAGEIPARGQPSPGIRYLFGPSGKLRERIEAGDEVQLFASAAPEHTERLLANGKLRSSNAFASNSLCVIARPGLTLSEDNIVATLLDANLKLGTSTPGADPSGDYTWAMFRKIEITHPGAFARLDSRALKLVGAEINASDTKPPYAELLVSRRADIFVTYCTNAQAAQRAVPAISFVRVPAAYDIATSYTIGITPGASSAAREFLRFVLSQRAQKVLTELGFSPPPQRCDHVEPMLKAAHAAWSGPAAALVAGAGASDSSIPAPSIRIATRHSLTLLPAGALRFRHRAQAAVAGTYGGALQFVAADSGRMEVFADRRAWIDVVRVANQESLASVRGERWLGCAGVGKNIGFLLRAGERYELRLSEFESAQAAVLLMPMAEPVPGRPAQ